MNIVIFFLFSFSAAAVSIAGELEHTIPYKQTTCRLGSKKADILLRFEKKVDPENNDYSGAPLVYLKTKRAHSIEPLQAPEIGDFSFVAPEKKSICKDTLGIALTKNIAAIFYTSDNRPFQSIYHVLIWNSKTDKILEKRSLGPVSEIIETKSGFAFSNLIPRSDADERTMTSESGRKMVATDRDLNALKVVALDGQSLKWEFDPALSFEKSQWKRFFKNKEE